MGVVGGPDPIVTDGLVFYMDAANKQSYPGSGTTVTNLLDTNTGTMSGTTFSSVNFGCFNFDGNSDQIDFSSFPDVNSTWTVELWLRTSTTNYITALQVADSGTTGTNDAAVIVNKHPGGASAVWGFYDGASVVEGSSLNTNNTWYHCVVTLTGTTYTLYLNGSQDGSGTGTARNIVDLLIGRRSYSGFYYNGDISNVKIYSKKLEASEVLQNYNALKDRFQ
jgi:hypothetical protein